TIIVLKVKAPEFTDLALEVPKFDAGLIIAKKNSEKTKNWRDFFLMSFWSDQYD
ncbi:hypothetical protein HGM15179_020730, partial [Zosterops borbonicus]